MFAIHIYICIQTYSDREACRYLVRLLRHFHLLSCNHQCNATRFQKINMFIKVRLSMRQSEELSTILGGDKGAQGSLPLINYSYALWKHNMN